jgi:hypothetical protein
MLTNSNKNIIDILLSDGIPTIVFFIRCWMALYVKCKWILLLNWAFLYVIFINISPVFIPNNMLSILIQLRLLSITVKVCRRQNSSNWWENKGGCYHRIIFYWPIKTVKFRLTLFVRLWKVPNWCVSYL